MHAYGVSWFLWRKENPEKTLCRAVPRIFCLRTTLVALEASHPIMIYMFIAFLSQNFGYCYEDVRTHGAFQSDTRGTRDVMKRQV